MTSRKPEKVFRAQPSWRTLEKSCCSSLRGARRSFPCTQDFPLTRNGQVQLESRPDSEMKSLLVWERLWILLEEVVELTLFSEL